MTLHILEPDKQINVTENSVTVSVRNIDTESKRIEFLQGMLDSMKQSSGEFKSPPGFIDILSQSLCDKLPSSRCLALDLLSSVLPEYRGNQLDILFPQLLQNLLNNNVSVKKATLQVLHMYFKHSQDNSMLLDYLIKYGIKSDRKVLQNEVFLAMPALVHSGFTQRQLEDIFVSILSGALSNENKESSLPLVLCLEHIKDEMGDQNFERCFYSLDESLCALYNKIVKHFSFCEFTKHDSRTSDLSRLLPKESCKNSEDDSLVFGFVPKRIISRLDNGVSWQERSDVINEFLAVVSTQMHDNALKSHCGELLNYLCTLIEDHNFNVALTSLTILHKVIVKVGPSIRYHLEVILKTLVKKLNDPKLVVRKLNLRISLSLMHCVSPTSYIQNILPLLKHKSARIREEIINIIIAALLSFPSSYFHLTVMPSQISFTLLDPKRRVRHASLECLAVLSQKLGPGKLSCLVSSVDIIEKMDGGAGVLAAVQTRLGRRILPRINEEGFVQYALTIPSGIHPPDSASLDIAWIIAGAATGNDSSKKIHESPDTLGKRHLSAGKKKLPWQNDINVEIPERKMGSAPVRQGTSNSADISNHVSVVHDTWVNDTLHSNKPNKLSKNMLAGHPKSNNESPLSPTDISYFEVYKTKMRELKAAGLQADAEMIKSIKQSINPRDSLDAKANRVYSKDNKKDLSLISSSNSLSDRSNNHDILSPLSADRFGGLSPNRNESLSPTSAEREHSQYSPVPVKPALARSASKRRQKVYLDEKKEEHLRHQNQQEQMLPSNVHAEKRRAAIAEGQSPFSSRPTIHRTPSGRINNKPILHEVDSNLTNMAAYSFSYPNLDISSFNSDGLSGNSSNFQKRKTSPMRMKDDAIFSSTMSDREMESSFNRIRGFDHPDAPKLAKSAQEKLRKLKEERLRHSIDSTTSLKKLKENRLSRSLDFNNIGLLEFKNNCVDYGYVADSIFNDKEGKNGSSDGIKKNNHTEIKHSKVKHEKRYKHKVTHDSPGSTQSNNSVIKSKMFDSTKDMNSITKNKMTFDSTKDSKDSLDLSFKSSASSEMSTSPSTPSRGLETTEASADVTNGFEDIANNQKKVTKRVKKKTSAKSKGSESKINIHNEEEFKEEIRHKKTYPLAASSPMCRRKNLSSGDPNNNTECLITTNDNANELNKELSNPSQSLPFAMELLQSEDWEGKCEGLCIIRRLARFHSAFVSQDIHLIVEAVLLEVKNLRSQVTRAALGCIGDLFAFVPKLVESELEVILKGVLTKASDTNQFIRFDVDEALKKMVDNVNSPKAIASIISTGASHRNALVRKVCAKYVADLAEKMGSSKLLTAYKGIIGVAAKLSVDPQPDARYHGRRILFLFIDEIDLDKQLAKEVPSANIRPVQDIIENLKNKGLGHPPTESASMRRSSRNGMMSHSSRSDVGRASTQNLLKGSQTENYTPTKKDTDNEVCEKPKRRASHKDPSSTQVLNLECLKKLESNNWSERYEGLDQFYNLVSAKPSEVSANSIKVFDKFCPRLADSNSKVNLHALQTLNRCIPILKNGMASTSTIIIDNLKTSLASKNEGIYSAAKDSLVTLTKYVDNTYLLQPLIAAVQYANVRNKAELAESLADIILPAYNKKPGLVVRTVLPLLWSCLSSTNSGISTPGRSNFQHELSRMCKILYQCLGKELLTEAASKGSRASQKLEIMLQ